MANDPYKELGVSRQASADDIRKSFRKLAKQLHPDRNPGDAAAEERFKRVTGAFDILGDVEKKAKFDKGEIDADGRETMGGFNPGGGFRPGGGSGFSGFGGGGGPGGGGFGGRFEGADFDEILGDMFSGRGARGPGGFSPKGADLRSRLEIDLEEAIQGGPKRVAFSDGRTIDLTIPKGAVEGQVLRLKSQGQAGPRGAGDALIELAIKPHPIFKLDGADLRMDLPVSIPDAVLGAKVDAPTPEGPVSLGIPKNTSSGAVLRLKGRGAVDPSTGGRGDLFARVMLALPEGDDAALTAFAETWRKQRPYVAKRRR